MTGASAGMVGCAALGCCDGADAGKAVWAELDCCGGAVCCACVVGGANHAGGPTATGRGATGTATAAQAQFICSGGRMESAEHLKSPTEGLLWMMSRHSRQTDSAVQYSSWTKARIRSVIS